MFNSGIHKTTLLLLMIMLSGCLSEPNYQTPELPAHADMDFVTMSSNTTNQQAPLSQWWRLYNDKKLDEIIKHSLNANTDLRIAEANLERAKQIYNEVGGARYPVTQITAGADYGRDQASWSGIGKASRQWTYSSDLSVSYEVDLFGRVHRSMTVAYADAQVEAARRDVVRLVIIAEVTRAYVDTCVLGKSIEIAGNSIAIANKSVELITQKEASGAASQLDVQRALANLAKVKATLEPIKAERMNRLFELTALMGLAPADMPKDAVECVKIPTLTVDLPIGDGRQLLSRRPDVRVAEMQLAADTARIGVAVSMLYPKIVLGAHASYLNDKLTQNNESWSFGIGPLISWSLPDVSVQRTRVEQAESKAAASLANFDGAVLNALKEVEQALVSYNATLQECFRLKGATEHANNAFLLAQQQYRAGSIGYLDVLSAQQFLVESEQELIAVEQHLGSQRVSLFLALGGGWENDNALSASSVSTEVVDERL
ncbi:MAG: efflux transporter outer membrane subunit [Pseudomonadales bacterium]|nr:efflux transporter outer membrane subunit [Pseudomonadales bacterium]